ncbi:MAG: DUF6259 domain-containing protein, partial [Gammaproteobacteria bacterium]
RIERRSDKTDSVWQTVGTTGSQAGNGSFLDQSLIIDDHAVEEYQYRIQAYQGIDVSSYANQWAVNCTAVPTDPEQQWLSQLPTQSYQGVQQPIWGPSLPLPSAQTLISGRNLDGSSCSADVDGHFPCRYVMLSNDKYAALFIAGQVPTGGTGGLVNAGGLVGLTHRNYGMEFIGWNGISNQHIWALALADENDLSTETTVLGGFQQAHLSAVTEEIINGEITLMFEWNLPEGLTVKTYWSLHSEGSPGLHGNLEVTGTYSDAGVTQGLLSVKFPQISAMGYSTSEQVNLVWPSRGYGIRINDFKNSLNREYLSSGLEAQFFGLEKGNYGLYLSAEDTDLHSKEMRIQNNLENSATHIKYFPYDGAGKVGNEITHAKAVLTPLCGGWPRIGKRYRRFVLDHRQADPAGSWISKGTIDARTDIPETIKRSVYWWTENGGNWNAEAQRQSANYLKRLIEDGSQRLTDFNNPPQVLPDYTSPVFPDGPPLGIHLYNWYHIPGFSASAFDIGLPDFIGKPGISAAISSMQSETQHTTVVAPYINSTDVDITTSDSLGHAAEWNAFVKRNKNTTSPYIVGSATGRDLAEVALNTQVWRDTNNTLTDYVLDLGNTGLTGVYLDTFGAANTADYDLNQTGRDVVDAKWVKSGETNSPRRGYGPWISASNQRLAKEVKDRSALRPGAFVTAEHFSEAYIDHLDMVFFYTSLGKSLPLNRPLNQNPDETMTELIGLVPSVYSDYQMFAGYRTSYLESVRGAAMKHGYGFTLGGQIGLTSRSQVGALKNDPTLPLTICDTTATASFAWLQKNMRDCPARLAYMSHLAQARYALQHIFRGEFLGHAEDTSAAAELSEYWCRGASCQPKKDVPDGNGGLTWPGTDICSDGGQPESASCAERYYPVTVPAIRAGTWVSPDGEKTIVLTNTDSVPRSGNIPIPNSWKGQFASARLCPAVNPEDASNCVDVSLNNGVMPVSSIAAYSAWYLYGCTSDLGSMPTLVSMQDTDGDMQVNGCDSDDDNDGLLDAEELIVGSNALLADTDGDTLSDGFEVGYGGVASIYNPATDLNPLAADTDGDGFNDDTEVIYNSDPLDANFIPANGDVNDDGVVNAADILLAQQVVLGMLTPSATHLVRGDVAPSVNGVPTPDGVLGLADSLLITRKVLGLANF